LKIDTLFALIGGSVGELNFGFGAQISSKFYSIATDWKATDWLIANCYLQEQNLNNSKRPIEDARVHAMFATDAGVFKVKFNRDVNTQLETFKWRVGLNYMGKVREKVSTFSL
jgi:hypothetical protein